MDYLYIGMLVGFIIGAVAEYKWSEYKIKKGWV